MHVLSLVTLAHHEENFNVGYFVFFFLRPAGSDAVLHMSRIECVMASESLQNGRPNSDRLSRFSRLAQP